MTGNTTDPNSITPEGLVRFAAKVADRDAAREMAERLAAMAGEAGTGPLATSWLETPDSGGYVVEAYFDGTPDGAAIVEAIGDLVAASGAEVEIAPVPDVNWVAISQAALPPVATGRFVVHGSHDRARVGWLRGAIEIEAGEAFGTAHHATTQGCLAALDRLARRVRAPRRVLDLRTGTGVLGIAAARLWPKAAIVGSDLDPVSVGIAAENARLNRAGGRIRFATAAGLAHRMIRSGGRYDVIVANILAGPLIALAPEIARAASGRVVLSGILGEQAREVIGAYRMAGLILERHDIAHNWATLQLVAPRQTAR